MMIVPLLLSDQADKILTWRIPGVGLGNAAIKGTASVISSDPPYLQDGIPHSQTVPLYLIPYTLYLIGIVRSGMLYINFTYNMFNKLKVGITSILKYNVIFTHKLDSVIKLALDFFITNSLSLEKLGVKLEIGVLLSPFQFFKEFKGCTAHRAHPVKTTPPPPHTQT